MTVKGILDVMVGEIFSNGGPDYFQQQLQLVICMTTANPFLGFFTTFFG